MRQYQKKLNNGDKMNETKHNTVGIREHSREQALKELKQYRDLLIMSAQKKADDTGNERGTAKTLGAHPKAGKNYATTLSPKEENEEYKWLTNGGFTSAVFLSVITLVTSACFFILSYLFYS